MRILLVLTSCFGLALFAGAAQQDDQDTNKGKKKGGQNVQSQQVVAPTPHPGGKAKFHAQGSERANLNSSKSNKLESINKGGSEKWKGPNLNAKQGQLPAVESTA